MDGVVGVGVIGWAAVAANAGASDAKLPAGVVASLPTSCDDEAANCSVCFANSAGEAGAEWATAVDSPAVLDFHHAI